MVCCFFFPCSSFFLFFLFFPSCSFSYHSNMFVIGVTFSLTFFVLIVLIDYYLGDLVFAHYSIVLVYVHHSNGFSSLKFICCYYFWVCLPIVKTLNWFLFIFQALWLLLVIHLFKCSLPFFVCLSCKVRLPLHGHFKHQLQLHQL
jgi:hypothetical protein